jgi:prepilin-type N-terminal cleavage/methylation domain-containing protein
MKKGAKGFTLIELMIVVAIIGILAAIAIPKFAELIRKSSEGATKGNLGAVRSALSIYYGDQEGKYPVDAMQSLTANAKYLDAVPTSKTPNYHPDGNGVFTISSNTATNINDNGGWVYVNNNASTDWGTMLVNCTHTDTKGNYWTSY